MKRINWILVALGMCGIFFALLLTYIIIEATDTEFLFLSKIIDPREASQIIGFIVGFSGLIISATGVFLIFGIFDEQRKLSNRQQNELMMQIQRQQFESTFFNLISTYYNIIYHTKGEVDFNHDCNPKEYYGRFFFSTVLNQIKTGFKLKEFRVSICKNCNIPEIKEFHKARGINIDNESSIIKLEREIENAPLIFISDNYSDELIIALYEFFYKKYKDILGHYCRFIYNIIKFAIEEREYYKDEKYYIDFLRAQLSSCELGLLFYNALSKFSVENKGETKFYYWLNKYDFFENIDEDSLIIRNDHAYYDTKFKFLTNEEKKAKFKI